MARNRLRQLASESLIYGIPGILLRGGSLFLTPIYTRVFSPADYGVMGLVLVTIGLFRSIITLGLDSAAARWYRDTEEVADRKTTIATWAWCQWVVSLAIALALIGFADTFERLLGGGPDTATCLRLGAASLLFSGLSGVLNRWLRYERRAWTTAGHTLFCAGVTILLTVLLVVVYRQGLRGFFAAQIIGDALGALVTVALMRDWLHSRHVCTRRLRDMLRYGLPLVSAGPLVWVLNLIDRYFIQYYQSTDQVGLYQVGASIAGVLGLLVSAFTQAWGPYALSISKAQDARNTYSRAFLAYIGVTCFFATALVLFTPEALRLLTTASYYGASTVVGFLAMSWVLEGVYYIAALGASISKQTRPVGKAIVLAAASNIILNFALIPRWGKEGAAIATLLSHAIRVTYLFHCSQRLYPIPYPFGRGLLLGLVSLAIMTLSGSWQFASIGMALLLKIACLVLLLVIVAAVTGIGIPSLMRLARRSKELRPGEVPGGGDDGDSPAPVTQSESGSARGETLIVR